MNGNQLLNLWENQRLCLLNIEKFAKGTFTWVNNNNVNEKSVIDYTFSNYDFLPNVVSFEIDAGENITLGARKRRERHFLTIMQWLSNSKSAGSHITMLKKGMTKLCGTLITLLDGKIFMLAMKKIVV